MCERELTMWATLSHGHTSASPRQRLRQPSVPLHRYANESRSPELLIVVRPAAHVSLRPAVVLKTGASGGSSSSSQPRYFFINTWPWPMVAMSVHVFYCVCHLVDVLLFLIFVFLLSV
ncbi:hypothetical protein BKA93DRAFT_154360 [Sparassis latifolia]